MFDLAKFEAAAESGAILELKDPAGRPLMFDTDQPDPNKPGKMLQMPITIMLAGIESPRWTQAADALTNKLQDLKDKRSMQDIRNDRAAILAKMTLDWEGIMVDGKALECTEDNAKKVYVRFKWLMEQVDKFVGDRQNFLPAS